MAPVIEYSSSSSGPLGSGSVVEFEREGLTATTYLLASANPKKRAGRTKFRETRHPVYRGVRRRDGGKWVCEVRNSKNKSKSRLWLGTYPTAEMAARAHDVAVLALRGRSACLNFADSAWRLPIPDTGSDADIRAAAAEAAEAFRPRESEEETGSCSSSSSYEDACSVSDAESSSEAVTAEDDVGGSESQSSSYLDEEAIFFMPELLVDMAEGLMMSPPPIVFGDGLNWDGDHQFCASDVPIWNF